MRAKRDDLSIQEAYREAFLPFADLYEKAKTIFPSGVTHDGRFLRPFPIYIDRAKGSKKWDLKGNEYIDYWVGHGALLLGHGHPKVVEAVSKQVARGTHYGGCHELEIEWGQLVIDMVSSAEKVRFTSSGTEATLMALRLARSFTGKSKIIKFEGHFHGWHDHVAVGVTPPYDVPASPGLLREVVESTILCPPNDFESLENVMMRDDDVACVIIEPTGASFGTIPTTGDFLRELKKLTERYGVLLIFDEVITGFRCAPGGAQEYYNVTPDITTLAKILAGGLPGGCVAGRGDIMEILEFKADPKWDRYEKMAHPGTFNANPLSAAAGVATLKIISSGDEIAKANQIAGTIRKRLNDVIDEHGVNWCVYGDFSGFKVLMNHTCGKRGACDYKNCDYDYRKLKGADPNMVRDFRCGMILGGVDMQGAGGMTSSAHTLEDVEKTVEAFDSTLKRMSIVG